MDHTERDAFLQLLEKYYYGAASTEEVKFIEALLETDPFALELWEDTKQAFAENKQMTEETSQNRMSRGRFTVTIQGNYSKAGIIVLLLLGIGTFFIKSRSRSNKVDTTGNTTPLPPPKKKEVVLQLANGITMQLEGNGGEQDTTRPATRIDSMARGQLNKDLTANNTLIVPRGVTYAMELSEGSTAFVNSASKVKFPFVFNRSKREISMDEGEIYLKVAADSRAPFVVHTALGDVIAHGSSFNISVYNGKLSVSLVSGLVVIVKPFQENSCELRPGDQATYTAGQSGITIKKLETSTLGWLQGRNKFEDATLVEVCELIGKVHDIDAVIDDPDLEQTRFGGAIVKSIPIETVLKNICAAGKFQYYFDQQHKLHFKQGVAFQRPEKAP